jgi:hypothetical protein
MKLTTNGIDQTVATVEAAAKTLVRLQPREAAVNGVVIDDYSGGWTELCAVEEVAAALAAGDWYWIDGSAYCPACVECKSPAIDAGNPNVQRGGAVSVCSCCGTDYNS